jgi:REP element-mobilizing transposase RayT
MLACRRGVRGFITTRIEGGHMATTPREQVFCSPTTCHLIWTTYGTWLHGDERGWYEWGVGGRETVDPEREFAGRARMAGTVVTLADTQRHIVEDTIRRHCDIRGWTLHAVAVMTTHVHVVVTSDRTTAETANQLKAWCSRKLSDAAGLVNTVARKAGRGRWFTEGVGRRVIETDEYLAEAINYVVKHATRASAVDDKHATRASAVDDKHATRASAEDGLRARNLQPEES